MSPSSADLIVGDRAEIGLPLTLDLDAWADERCRRTLLTRLWSLRGAVASRPGIGVITSRETNADLRAWFADHRGRLGPFKAWLAETSAAWIHRSLRRMVILGPVLRLASAPCMLTFLGRIPEERRDWVERGSAWLELAPEVLLTVAMRRQALDTWDDRERAFWAVLKVMAAEPQFEPMRFIAALPEDIREWLWVVADLDGLSPVLVVETLATAATSAGEPETRTPSMQSPPSPSMDLPRSQRTDPVEGARESGTGLLLMPALLLACGGDATTIAAEPAVPLRPAPQQLRFDWPMDRSVSVHETWRDRWDGEDPFDQDFAAHYVLNPQPRRDGGVVFVPSHLKFTRADLTAPFEPDNELFAAYEAVLVLPPARGGIDVQVPSRYADELSDYGMKEARRRRVEAWRDWVGLWRDLFIEPGGQPEVSDPLKQGALKTLKGERRFQVQALRPRAPGRLLLLARWEYDPDDQHLREVIEKAHAYHVNRLGQPEAEFRAEVLVREELTIDTNPATLQSERVTRRRWWEVRYGDGHTEHHMEDVEYSFSWIDPNSRGTIGSGRSGNDAAE